MHFLLLVPLSTSAFWLTSYHDLKTANSVSSNSFTHVACSTRIYQIRATPELTVVRHDGGEQPSVLEALQMLNDCWKH